MDLKYLEQSKYNVFLCYNEMYVKQFLFNLTMSLTSVWNPGINIHDTKGPNATCAAFVQQKQFPDTLKFMRIKPNKQYTLNQTILISCVAIFLCTKYLLNTNIKEH